MCAICGVISFSDAGALDRQHLREMTDRMRHRGPDDEGFYVEGPAALGFRRLSIIDLEGGHQPILNEDGSIAIIFNGEIYNYRELMSALVAEGHIFRTRSDGETILHAYEQYGDACVERLRGMFAFAIWDSKRQRLLLARDRLGIKPIYYYRDNDRFVFASEVKALLQIPAVPREVDASALDQYLLLRYVPGAQTMFKDVFRLEPGHRMTVDRSGVRIEKYWELEFPAETAAPVERSLEEFRSLLEESVRLRLMSEVPLGVFLSGGIDSSAILAVMAKLSRADSIKTFSVGYETSSPQDERANEFEYARLAAAKFGCDHHECRISSRDFESFLPDLVWGLDEPLADPTCIPLYFLSRQAREQITVVLSGEGADEILAGYGIYSKLLKLGNLKHAVPGLQGLMSRLYRFAPSERLRRRLRISGRPLEEGYRGVCRGLGVETAEDLIGADRVGQAEQQVQRVFSRHFEAVAGCSSLSRMLYVDTKIWLPDDLLLKADKMTMANGLELRVPFLDHRLVEFAAKLPDHQKLHEDRGKYLLRETMRGILPDAIIDRPKKGFPVPIAPWLRGPLRQFAREHLLSRNSACDQYFDRRAIHTLLTEHEKGVTDRSQEIWTLLVFQSWHQRFIEGDGERRQAA